MANDTNREYWNGYRSAYIEVLMMGLEQVQAKYWAEDNETPYLRGFKRGLEMVTDKAVAAIRRDAAIRRSHEDE